MTNSAFSASEARHLCATHGDTDWCDRIGCTNHTAEGSILCGAHEDEINEYEGADNRD